MKGKIFFALVLVSSFFACSGDGIKKTKKEKNIVKESKEESKIAYGIPVDSLLVFNSEINDNEFLSNILSRHNVDYNVIDKLSKESRNVFDVRKIQSGRSYCVIADQDSTAQCFIYEPNALEYIVYDFRNPDSIVVYKEERPVEIKEQTISGVINNSLYVAMQRNGGDPNLAIALSEIYAWTIDFYRIQPGDKFKVVYDQKLVEGEPVGFGKIKAAYFQHKDEEFYAFHFDQDGVKGYYNEEGKSSKKAFLQAPLKFSRISSRYSPNRLHPVLKTKRPHLGTDYAAPHGTPIMSTGDGTVIEAGFTRGNGNYVKVKHNGTYTTQYLHMSKIAVRKGKFVKQGETIGYVGSTGLATGPHVCYRFWKNNRQVDPYKEKTPHAEPIKATHKEAFAKVKDEYKAKLDAIEYKDKQNQERLLSQK